MVRYRLVLSLILLICCACLWAVESPPPVATPAAVAADWLGDPAGASAAGETQADATAATAAILAPPGGWLSWALGLLGTALLIARNSQTANPLARSIFTGLSVIWNLLAPKYAQDAEQKRDLSAEALARLVAYIDEADAKGGTAADVKQLVMKRLPSALSDRVDEILDLLRPLGSSGLALAVSTERVHEANSEAAKA